MRRFILFFIILMMSSSVQADEPFFPRTEKPLQQFFVGEKIVAKMSYLGIPLGWAESEVKEIVSINGHKAYHIMVRVRSDRWVDWVYKVRDEHHSYVDREHLYSLRYEKNLQEGRNRSREVMEYDQENHVVFYEDKLRGVQKKVEVPFGVQDQLSCGYYFRTIVVEPQSEYIIPVNTGEKNWEMKVKTYEMSTAEFDGIGRFEVLETEPLIEFQGIFVKRGKMRGWMSLDERRIPLRMTVKIPVFGRIVAEVVEYTPGRME